ITDPQPAIGIGPTLEAPTDVAYDEARDRVYVMEADFGDKLVEVNPNGDRRTLADASVGVGINFRGLRGLDFDASTRTIYAVDYVADIIVSIDATNGNRDLISGPVDGRGTIDQSPLDLALDKSRGVVYVADFQTDSVYALNIETGQRVVVADAATGVGPTLYRPQSLRIDAQRGVVYVLNLDSTVISVDVATGARSRIGDDSLGQVSGIALDAEKGVLYTAEENSGAIKRVDLATGVVSTVSAGVPFFSSVGAIALDRAQNRILMIEDYPLRLSSVDIATGSRSIVSGEVGLTKAPARGNGTPLGGPSEIEIDEERHIAYISDDQYDAIFAIDLDSGDRQIISK
ncbi:MAG TPA: hypothetical protein VFS24_14200, partial [Steroidobacteraceae bacterium]|nr:hypothetical protein [Steroidobacteraceae bacterium]